MLAVRWLAKPMAPRSPGEDAAAAGLVEDVEQQEGDQREAGAGGDHALVLADDRRGGAVVGAVVDQVEVAEDPVDDGRDREHHLVADQRRVDGVDRVGEHGARR